MLSEVNKHWLSLGVCQEAGYTTGLVLPRGEGRSHGAGLRGAGKRVRKCTAQEGAERGGHIGEAVVWFLLLSPGQNIKQKFPGSGSGARIYVQYSGHRWPWIHFLDPRDLSFLSLDMGMVTLRGHLT